MESRRVFNDFVNRQRQEFSEAEAEAEFLFPIKKAETTEMANMKKGIEQLVKLQEYMQAGIMQKELAELVNEARKYFFILRTAKRRRGKKEKGPGRKARKALWAAFKKAGAGAKRAPFKNRVRPHGNQEGPGKGVAKTDEQVQGNQEPNQQYSCPANRQGGKRT